MFWKQLFAKKSLTVLLTEAQGDDRLRRVLGPIGLTSLGVGAIIGAGIFVMTGRVAADDAGPAIVLSFVVAGIGCALAAFCYAEFASMAPVAGSAYTYAYATLGELLAWIIGWDLILEYAMSCATVGAVWSKYLNELTRILFNWQVPDYLCHDPFSHPGAWLNLPAVLILALVTTVLVIGIRESAASNTVLVLVKLGVVLFVIAMGAGFVSRSNWFGIRPEERRLPEQAQVVSLSGEMAKEEDKILGAARELAKFFGAEARKVTLETDKGVGDALPVPEKSDLDQRADVLRAQSLALYLRQRSKEVSAELREQGKASAEEAAGLSKRLEQRADAALAAVAKKHKVPTEIGAQDRRRAEAVIARAKEKAPQHAASKWGMLGWLGLNKMLTGIDDAWRSNYTPYGLSGIMLGAALVFFAFIGFDSISTHAEEAVRPQRDVPFGILASLFLCTLLYIAVSAIITGMQPYPEIDVDAAVASAFRLKGEQDNNNPLLRASAGLIAAGGLAGMTSVLLITFLSQARIFLAMARDHLLPPGVFGAVHAKFRTPHISTMITGGVIVVVAAFTPIFVLEEMVNIGTLFAFVVVCAAVLILRIKRPESREVAWEFSRQRARDLKARDPKAYAQIYGDMDPEKMSPPFRCPFVFLVAPLGILVNVTMMLFLPPDTWLRLVVWLLIGLIIYFGYSRARSTLGKEMRRGVSALDPGGRLASVATGSASAPVPTGPPPGEM